MRVIYVPGAEKWIPLKNYIKGVQTAKAHPEAEFKHGLTCWWPCTGREIIGQFLVSVHDRINQKTPYINRGNGDKVLKM